MFQELLDIVDMVRGNYPEIHRITLGVLIVIQVHARDTLQELFEQKVENVNEFEWLA